MTFAYYITQSPIDNLYLVAKWDDEEDTMHRHLDTVICAVPSDEVVAGPKSINRIIYPDIDNLPIPADQLGTVRGGDGTILVKRADASGLAELTGWYVGESKRGQGIGWALFELAFKLAYAFGFAGIRATLEGLRDERVAIALMKRLNVLTTLYQAELTRVEETWVIIRWASRPDYHFSLPREALDDIPPVNR
jgi:hypothetical protein